MNTSTSNKGKQGNGWNGTRILKSVLCAGVCLGGPFAWADDIPFISNEADSSQKLGYDPSWTAEDYMNAKPLTLERDYYKWSTNARPTESKVVEQKDAPKAGEGMAPTGEFKPDLNHFIHPPIQPVEARTTLHLSENSRYGENIAQPESIPYLPFSSSLVNLIRAAAKGGTAKKTLADESTTLAEDDQRSDLSFPYRTVGALFFKDEKGQAFRCSGAVIRPRLVVTAGQCVHSGNGDISGFYKEFRFVPAYKDGSAPFGVWDWAYVRTTIEWANGGGTVPNPADYAILEMSDQNGTKIGDHIGYLGWSTKAGNCNQELYGLGYPSSISGIPNFTNEMRQITGRGTNYDENPTICLLGTDWGTGSGGGPWIKEFGWTVDNNKTRVIKGNYAVSVFSTVFTPTDPNDPTIVKGGSLFDSRWVTLINAACERNPGNC